MSASHERTVRIGGIQYRDPKGVWRFGLQGKTVRVHPDNVERFDAFNGDPSSRVPEPDPTVPEPATPEPSTPEPEPAPEPADEEPKRRSSRARRESA